jgi:hypothetical protein
MYIKPDFIEVELLEEDILCESAGTEEFVFDPTDPRHNYEW